ncbi:Alpha/Beta hydrolase protein [Mycena vulgaris]|nr:Alpha/Beta hydrolase protein [Mycena vulgaris]
MAHLTVKFRGARPADHSESNAELTPKEQAALARNQLFRCRGSGYSGQHSTRPQTLGYALADSPVGLLAWIYEKLVGWADNYPWDDDEVLTWVSIFWFSRAGPTVSIRIYFEAGNRYFSKVMSINPKPTIPLGLSHFPQDVLVFPRRHVYFNPWRWTRGLGNIVFEGEHDSGGHFAAYEKPNELVDDLRKMFGKDGLHSGLCPGNQDIREEPSC